MSGLQATAFGNSPAIRISRFRSPQTNTCPTWQLICPSGVFPVHPPREKYSAFAVGQISATSLRHPVPTRGAYRDRHGRWARDAMDAFGDALTNGADADGEVVWA